MQIIKKSFLKNPCVKDSANQKNNTTNTDFKKNRLDLKPPIKECIEVKKLKRTTTMETTKTTKILLTIKFFLKIWFKF